MPRDTRSALVDAAADVFERGGFRATNITAVIKAAGVSRMTLYNHFASKEDLAVAALRRRDEASRLAMARAVEAASTTPGGQLLALFDRRAEWCACDAFFGCLFVHAAAEYPNADHPIRRAAAEAKRRTRDDIAAIAETAGAPDPRRLATQLVLLLEGATAWAELVEQVDHVHGAHIPGGVAGDEAREAARTLIDAAIPGGLTD